MNKPTTKEALEVFTKGLADMPTAKEATRAMSELFKITKGENQCQDQEQKK